MCENTTQELTPRTTKITVHSSLRSSPSRNNELTWMPSSSSLAKTPRRLHAC